MYTPAQQCEEMMYKDGTCRKCTEPAAAPPLRMNSYGECRGVVIFFFKLFIIYFLIVCVYYFHAKTTLENWVTSAASLAMRATLSYRLFTSLS